MRTHIIQFLRGFLIATILYGTPFQLIGSEKIIITTGEYAPFDGQKLPNFGFANHVVTKAFQLSDVEVEYKWFDVWKRAYETSKNGEFPASCWWGKSEEREKDFFFPEPLLISKVVLFKLKSNNINPWNSFDELKKYKIGTTTGYTYLKEFINAITPTEAATDEANLKKLISGRIDLFPLDEVTGSVMLRTKFSSDMGLVDSISKPLNESPGFLIFSKAHKDSERLMGLFNTGLKKLKDSGEYDKMHNDLLNGVYSQ